jgi:hypothetical protein
MNKPPWSLVAAQPGELARAGHPGAPQPSSGELRIRVSPVGRYDRALVQEWLASAQERIAGASGLEAAELALSEQDRKHLLELARLAAHSSGDRTNAPLVCFLAGVALGRNPELDLAELAREAAAERP